MSVYISQFVPIVKESFACYCTFPPPPPPVSNKTGVWGKFMAWIWQLKNKTIPMKGVGVKKYILFRWDGDGGRAGWVGEGGVFLRKTFVVHLREPSIRFQLKFKLKTETPLRSRYWIQPEGGHTAFNPMFKEPLKHQLVLRFLTLPQPRCSSPNK